MCGRYTIIATAKEIERRFDVEVPVGYTPRYNAAPTQSLPVIINENDNRCRMTFFRWGLVPSWSKTKKHLPLINARLETLDEKATFKNALQHRRCLIPADGYYEWKRISKKSKIPYRICLGDRGLFAFAGIWELFTDENHDELYTFTIITTSASNDLSQIHDRMPVILDREAEKIWLNESMTTERLTGLLQKNHLSNLNSYSVSSMVNSVIKDDLSLIAPAPAVDQYGNLSLF